MALESPRNPIYQNGTVICYEGAVADSQAVFDHTGWNHGKSLGSPCSQGESLV
jgi:hypothetical protein